MLCYIYIYMEREIHVYSVASIVYESCDNPLLSIDVTITVISDGSCMAESKC